MQWYTTVLKKYAVFSGRARRKEYWFFVLINFFVTMGLGIIENVVGLQLGDKEHPIGILSSLYSVFVLVPNLAVSVRRLHDTSRSGLWILINLLPCVGWIIYLVFMFQDSTPIDNEYGPNPKALTG